MIDSQPINVGVVGVGHLGRIHARVYSEIPHANLVGVCDSNRSAGEEIAKKHNTRFFERPEDLMQEVEAVSVAVPTPMHLETASPFLANSKAVLVEKPLASTVAEADELIALADKNNAVLQVGHIERFNPVITAALPYLKQPLFIECDRIHPFNMRSTDVSVVLDLMIHDIDLVLHLTDDEVVELDAVGASVLSPTEDLSNARIVFQKGCTAMVKTSRVAMSRSRKIRVFSEHSYISLDLVEKHGSRIFLKEGYDAAQFLDENGRISDPGGETAFLAQNLRTENIEIPETEPLKAELESFLDAAAGKITPAVTGAQGRRAMLAADMIHERMKFHRDRIAKLMLK